MAALPKETKTPESFALSECEAACLGYCTDSLRETTGLIQTYLTRHYIWFNCCNVDYRFEHASSRDGRMILHNKAMTVSKTANGSGLFPTVAAQSVRLEFRTEFSSCSKTVQLMRACAADHKEVGGLEFDESALPEVLTIRNTRPERSILVFDFNPHNFGFDLAFWTRSGETKTTAAAEPSKATV